MWTLKDKLIVKVSQGFFWLGSTWEQESDFYFYLFEGFYQEKVGGKGDAKGWDGWMASLTEWTWVWVNPRSWWWTGRPGVLESMGCKESDMTEQLNWTDSPWVAKSQTRLSDFHFHFLCEFSAERFAHNLMAVPFYVICHFLLVAFYIFKFLSSW